MERGPLVCALFGVEAMGGLKRPRRAALLAALGIAVAANAGTVPFAADVHAAAWCPQNQYGSSWSVQEQSGTGNNNHGTAVITTMPSQWSVSRSDLEQMKESVLVGHFSSSGSLDAEIDAGYFSGHTSQTSWTNGLLPYYNRMTYNEVDGAGHYLPAGRANVPIRAVVGGRVSVNDWNVSFSYSVSSPAVNLSFGYVATSSSVSKPGSWMGDASGNPFTGLWTPDGSHWYTWGYHNDCQNDPYWVTSKGHDTWVNGGA